MRLLPLLLCLTTVTISAQAQTQTYKAGKITFSQLGPFTQQQLEDATGLHTGSIFTVDQLSAAAQRLNDSGYFDEVGASLAGTTVNFDTKPTDRSKMLPVRFENLVWLTHAEIEAAIHAKFPLFIDVLPENSPHQQEIAAALAQKSVTAEVGAETFEPTLNHPLREIGFRITKPVLRVANIKLDGVTPALAPLLQKSVNATAKTRYTEGPAKQTTVESILAPLRDAGYIQAKLTGVTAVPSPPQDGTIGIVLTAQLDAGDVYHFSSISFAGSPLLSADAFTAGLKLHPGDIASHKALIESIAPIDAAYRRKGYMDVIVDAAPTLDSAARTVAYNVTVTPGEPYRIHEVTADNLDPAARADFDRGFLLQPGELYNPEYVSGFLKNNTALQALAHYSASFKAIADPNTHTVDLIITFIRGS
jgi:outer membrane protein insertion porin family